MKPSTLGTLLAALLGAAGCAPYPASDVPSLVTPPEMVEQMLRLAKVAPTDIVYDLGSGDGRLVIAAVQDFRARAAIGIEIDPALVARSRERARRAGVGDRVTFLAQDFFRADLGAGALRPAVSGRGTSAPCPRSRRRRGRAWRRDPSRLRTRRRS